MWLSHARWMGLLAGVVLLSPTVVLAQGASVGVFVGKVTPTQDLFQIGTGSNKGHYRIASGSLRGGTVGARLSRRIGFSLSGGKAETALGFTNTISGATAETDAELKYASFQGSFGLTPGTGPLQPYVAVGVGYVQRGGAAFSGQQNLSSYGLVLGAGLQMRVALLVITLGAEVMDYSATLEVAGQATRQFLQRDVQLRLGGGLAVGR